MKIAVLSDIHGNLPAFEAALAEVDRLKVDRLVIAGDVVNGSPDSRACWALAQELDCPILRGNHERYVSDFGTPRADPLWETEQFAPVQWTVKQFSEAERRAMGAWPLTVQFPDAPEVLFVHASARKDTDTVMGYTPDEDLAQMFPGVTAKWILRGHNHLCQCRFWGERVIVTAGSVGLPLDGRPTVQFAVLERNRAGWQVRHHAVPYDVDAAVRRFYESGYLDACGGMARIFLKEVATAGHVLVSFFHAYNRWEDRDALGFNAAVDRFFAMF